MKSTDESPREFWIAMTDFRLAFAGLRKTLHERFQLAEVRISSYPDLDRDRTMPLGKQIAFGTALELVDEFEDKITRVAHDRPSGRCVWTGDDSPPNPPSAMRLIWQDEYTEAAVYINGAIVEISYGRPFYRLTVDEAAAFADALTNAITHACSCASRWNPATQLYNRVGA